MYQKQKLTNGLTLITAPLKETKAVTVLVLLPVGSRYESQNINGASHFVEHLMFKGTKKRPTSLDITKVLDAVGADYNAFTTKDHTGYYVKIAAEKIELAFDILSDMIFDSILPPSEIEKERGVILEEIKMYEDNPMMYLPILFEETLFGKTPLGWSIAGPKSVIKKISQNQLLNYYRAHYSAAKMVLAVAGNFDRRQINLLAKNYFGRRQKKSAKTNFSQFKVSQTSPRLNLSFRKTQQVQLGLGFPAYRLNDKKIFPLYLLSIILGGNMSSRLFISVREEHGLAYYIRTDLSAYQDTGNFMVAAGLDSARIFAAIKLILAELNKIKERGVSPQELKNAKEFLRGKLVLDLEDSENVADWYAKQELLLNQIQTPAERLKKIFAVSQNDIKKVANEIIQRKKLNLALIGPFKQKKEFEKLLNNNG
ncbi:MAG TPA: pitrilysin family protein [Patescibacteria group bacterium]|nr:pitrilysin family protein [Patescibacteria group bacterium]